MLLNLQRSVLLESPSIVSQASQARAFEIQAMQKAMNAVKYVHTISCMIFFYHSKLCRSAASTRVWQSLPRHLRRRAASHDVRRVPIRLREKARREVCL